MQLISTDRLLTLLRTALDATIAPELRTADANVTADAMRAVLDELRKREHGAAGLLHAQIASGHRIAERMQSFLDALGNAIALPSVPEYTSNSDHRELRSVHAALTVRLATLAAALAAQRAQSGEGADAQRLSALLREAAEWERRYYADVGDMALPAPVQPPVPTRGKPLTRDSLEAFLRTCHADRERCAVTRFEAIAGGFSKQTFRIALRDAAGVEQTLIVRKNAAVQAMAYGGFLIENEFHLLQSVHATGLPVAQPLFLGKDVAGVDADFYVMTELPGTLHGSFLGGVSRTIPQRLILGMAELLARLHRLAPARFSAYLERYAGIAADSLTLESCYRREIAAARAYHARESFLPSPYLVYLFDWLEQNIPRSANPPVLVHGDFNIHNLLAEDERITGILDWECANFGAPEQDLAWIKPHIAPLIDWNRFVAHYQASGGATIDEDTLRFCTAFNAMRTSLAANKQTHNVQSGIEPSIKMAMIELGFALAHMRIV
jgi:aminoglycoside phosphotransferase (APT) family kinase protein